MNSACKKSIFGSKGEEGGFRSIAHSWGDQYYVASNFQFAQLFEPDENIRDKSNFFFKTSIDYILCSKDYAPILAIDFDARSAKTLSLNSKNSASDHSLIGSCHVISYLLSNTLQPRQASTILL